MSDLPTSKMRLTTPATAEPREVVSTVSKPSSSSDSLEAVSIDELRRSTDGFAHRRAEFHNWAKTFYSRTTATYKPRTVEDVRRVVELARREGKELRASGSGHSPSDLVCTGGYILNLDRLDRFISADRDKATFWAEAGMKLSRAHEHLDTHELAMSSLGSISDQTLAGAISTATHGSSVIHGNLSTTVTAIDIVLPLPGAPVKRVDKENDPDLFNASLCGLGSTGIIVAIEMKVEKKFKLEEELFVMRYRDFVDHWDAIANSAQHARCWWFPQLGLVKVSRMNRTTKAVTPPAESRIVSWLTNTFVAKYVHAAVLIVSKAFPRILPYHAWFMWNVVHSPTPIDWRNLFRPEFAPSVRQLGPAPTKTLAEASGRPASDAAPEPFVADLSLEKSRPAGLPMLCEPVTRVDWSVSVFNYDCGFPQYTYEAAVPLSQTTACLSDLERWHSDELDDPSGLRTHFPYEIRWTAADEIWLSPTYGTGATYIGAIQYRPFGLAVPYKKIWAKFSEAMKRNGARPHWAKSHAFSLKDLEERYDRLGDWLEVRKRVDPDQVLVNAYVRRHLLGQIGEDVDFRRWKKSVLTV